MEIDLCIKSKLFKSIVRKTKAIKVKRPLKLIRANF